MRGLARGVKQYADILIYVHSAKLFCNENGIETHVQKARKPINEISEILRDLLLSLSTNRVTINIYEIFDNPHFIVACTIISTCKTVFT